MSLGSSSLGSIALGSSEKESEPKTVGRSRFIPGKGYVKGFTEDSIPAIGFTTSRAPIVNADGRPIIGAGYVETSSEHQIIGSGYSLVEPTLIKYAIRTQAGWDSMSGPEQAEYEGFFDTLSAWEAIIPTDLVAVNQQWVAECYNDWPTGLADYIIIAARTTDYSRNIIISTPLSERHDGTPNSGFRLKNSGNFTILSVNRTDYISISGLNFILDVTVTYRYALINQSYDSIINACIFQDVSSVATGNLCANAGRRNLITNCLAIGNGSNALSGFISGNFLSVTLANCTSVGCTYGFRGPTVTGFVPTVVNCVSYDCTKFYDDTSTVYWGAETGYNASSTYTTLAPPDEIGGTNYTLNIVAADFVNPTNNDYNVANGSQLIDQGTDLSTVFTTDIVGTERG